MSLFFYPCPKSELEIRYVIVSLILMARITIFIKASLNLTNRVLSTHTHKKMMFVILIMHTSNYKHQNVFWFSRLILSTATLKARCPTARSGYDNALLLEGAG